MNRGSRDDAGYRLLAVLASMRPRFMNRGSDLLAFDGDLQFLASMRPRFMNRGSQQYAQHPCERFYGFNEAPIHESGK